MEIIRLNHDLSVNLNLPINSMTILLFEKIFLNTTISKKIHKNQIIIEIKHKYNLIFLCLNKLDELQYVIFKQTPKKAAIKSILPYHTLTDLLYDMYKIGIKLYPKKDFKLNSEKNDNYLMLYYSEIKNFNGLHISKTIDNESKIFLNRNLIAILNHENKLFTLSDYNEISIDLSRYLYDLICIPINNYNHNLNIIRDNLHKNIDINDKHLYDKIDLIIIEIQKQFNFY